MRILPVSHDIPAVLRASIPKPVPRGSGEHVARLTRWFESRFDCHDGLPRAWTLHPCDDALLARFNELSALDDANRITHEQAKELNAMITRDRCVDYYMYGFTCEGGPEKEKALCDAIQAEFQKLLDARIDPRPLLYWRRKPEMRYAAESHVDFNTREALPKYTPTYASISMRCAIPGCTPSSTRAYFANGMQAQMVTL